MEPNFVQLFSVFFGVEPDLKMIKTFDCLCYSSTSTTQRQKFDALVRKGMFLDYKHGIKGYITLDLHTGSILVSRNVVSYELDFHRPFVTL